MLTGIDSQGRVKIPNLILPSYLETPMDVAVFYCPKEEAIGILPPDKSWEGYRIVGVRNIDYEARINVGRYLQTLSGKVTKRVLVYSLNGIIYIKAM